MILIMEHYPLLNDLRVASLNTDRPFPIVMGILLTIASREKIGNTNDGNGQ